MTAAEQQTSRFTVDPVRGVGLATIVATLHVAILAARFTGRQNHSTPSILLSWHVPPACEPATVPAQEPPSNPHQTYCVGQLALTLGMAVVALTRWLHVMRVSGARTY